MIFTNSIFRAGSVLALAFAAVPPSTLAQDLTCPQQLEAALGDLADRYDTNCSCDEAAGQGRCVLQSPNLCETATCSPGDGYRCGGGQPFDNVCFQSIITDTYELNLVAAGEPILLDYTNEIIYSEGIQNIARVLTSYEKSSPALEFNDICQVFIMKVGSSDYEVCNSCTVCDEGNVVHDCTNIVPEATVGSCDTPTDFLSILQLGDPTAGGTDATTTTTTTTCAEDLDASVGDYGQTSTFCACNTAEDEGECFLQYPPECQNLRCGNGGDGPRCGGDLPFGNICYDIKDIDTYELSPTEDPVFLRYTKEETYTEGIKNIAKIRIDYTASPDAAPEDPFDLCEISLLKVGGSTFEKCNSCTVCIGEFVDDDYYVVHDCTNVEPEAKVGTCPSPTDFYSIFELGDPPVNNLESDPATFPAVSVAFFSTAIMAAFTSACLIL